MTLSVQPPILSVYSAHPDKAFAGTAFPSSVHQEASQLKVACHMSELYKLGLDVFKELCHASCTARLLPSGFLHPLLTGFEHLQTYQVPDSSPDYSTQSATHFRTPRHASLFEGSNHIK